jgi:hypothetical protein
MDTDEIQITPSIEANINAQIQNIKKRYAEITYGYRALSRPLEKLCKQKPNRANYNPISTVKMIKNKLRGIEEDCNALLQANSKLRAFGYSAYLQGKTSNMPPTIQYENTWKATRGWKEVENESE